jgi:hypothetical protein
MFDGAAASLPFSGFPLKTVTLNLGEALGIQQAFPYAKDPSKTPALHRVLAQQ